MLKRLGILFGALLISSSIIHAGIFDVFKDYNYISAKDTAKLIKENPQSIAIVDIQVKPEFEKEHLKGAIETNAYPSKKPSDLEKLTKIIPSIKKDQKVIVICPRGAGGAERSVKFLAKSGISKDRLFILSDGQHGWPREKINDVLITK